MDTDLATTTRHPTVAQRVRAFLDDAAHNERLPHHYVVCAHSNLYDTGAHGDVLPLLEAMVSKVPLSDRQGTERIVGLFRRASDERSRNVLKDAVWHGTKSRLGDELDSFRSELDHTLSRLQRRRLRYL